MCTLTKGDISKNVFTVLTNKDLKWLTLTEIFTCHHSHNESTCVSVSLNTVK